MRRIIIWAGSYLKTVSSASHLTSRAEVAEALSIEGGPRWSGWGRR